MVLPEAKNMGAGWRDPGSSTLVPSICMPEAWHEEEKLLASGQQVAEEGFQALAF